MASSTVTGSVASEVVAALFFRCSSRVIWRQSGASGRSQSKLFTQFI